VLAEHGGFSLRRRPDLPVCDRVDSAADHAGLAAAEWHRAAATPDLGGKDPLSVYTEKQYGQGIALSFVEYGQEIGAAHEDQGSSVVQHDEEVDGGWQHTSQDHHQHSVVLVHSLEQPVKSQHDEDQDGPAEQVADDAKTEERLVCGDVVGGRRRRVPMYEQFAGNIHEADGAGDHE
jgi:hypothetical protein